MQRCHSLDADKEEFKLGERCLVCTLIISMLQKLGHQEETALVSLHRSLLGKVLSGAL